MNYPIIFMDVDNTLIASLGELSDINRNALLRYHKMGGRIVFATGKVPSALNSLLDILDLNDSWQVAGNGAILFNRHQNVMKTIIKVGKRSQKCIETLERMKIPFYVYTNTEVLKNFDEDYLEHIEHLRMLQEPLPQKVNDFNYEDVLKILLFINHDDKYMEEQIKKQLKQYLDDLHVVRTSNYLLEIHDINQVKSTGIYELAKIENIDLKEAYAIGDSENDLAMLDVVGHPFVVDNANDEIKARGYRILPSCQENGVAYLIDSLLKDIHK